MDNVPRIHAGFETLDQRLRIAHKAIKALRKVITESEDDICYSKIRVMNEDVIVRTIIRKDYNESIAPLFKELSSKDTLDSETWITCFPNMGALEDPHKRACPVKTVFIATKIMPMTTDEIEAINKPLKERATEYKIWREIFILEVCKHIVMTSHFPNLPILYGWNVCKKHQKKNFINKNIIRAVEERSERDGFGHQVITLFNELANMDLSKWIIENISKKEEFIRGIEVIMFQVFCGLIRLEKEINLVHFDLHIQNVLIVDRLKETGFYEYILDSEHKWYIPAGILAYVWDFSLSGLADGSMSIGFFIKGIIRYGKRLISKDIYTKKSEVIAENINKENGIEYLYSYDTFRFSQSLLKMLELEIGKLYTAQGIKEDKMYEKLLDYVWDIQEAARDDLTKRLPRKKKKSALTGKPLDILLKYFNKYKKLPTEGQILKTIQIN